MDLEKQSERGLTKMLSRRTSVGCSSRLSYYRSGEGGVPFTWEKKPGIAKEKSPEEVIPPLTPPPALLSLGLPKPCIHHEPKHSLINTRLMRLHRFWKKGEIIRRRRRSNKKPEQECKNNEDCCYDEDVGFLDIDYTSDSESMMTSSPRGSVLSSYSSFSSSRSSSLSSMVKNNRREGEIYGRPFSLGCFPNVRVMVSVARRE
ncbi:hypothetical protein PIB30_001275 [Stylosanthes scabra]|uniref:Uncharacterized protein n=1 Tax=Stylosanthes scabra TaxID=79078 RepID=A0ABU6X2L1_9FABA|nr:hypothetical protein [Stylosanthes scabra]